MIVTQDSLASNFADVKWYVANFYYPNRSSNYHTLIYKNVQILQLLNLILVETREENCCYPKIGIYF
jgi:hypothetical protein